MGRTYATPEEFATWLGASSAPEGAAQLLRDASTEVDEMLLTAVYRVDDGMPAEQRVIDALRDATCAQAEHRDEHGDEITIIEGAQPVSLGPLRFGGTTGGRNALAEGIPQHSFKALRILRVAGLIPGAVQG